MMAASLQAPGTASAREEAAAWAHGPAWRLTRTGKQARFRGLAAVGRKTAWLAGSGGTVLRTTDGGRAWTRLGTGSFDTVDCAPDGACWAAGEKGRAARLTFTTR